MKITAVKTYVLEHPLSRPTGPSVFYHKVRRLLVVEIQTDAGISGWGDTVPFPGIRTIIDDHYTPLLLGCDPIGHRPLWRKLWGPNFGNGLALGAVDVALDDLRGKALGLPLAELYGGRLRERIKAYASPMGYIEGEDAVVTFPRWASSMVEMGFRALKLRIGGQAIPADVRAVSAVVKAVGSEVKVMADGNGAYTLGSAIRMGRELEQLGLYWFEEPLPESTPEYAGYEVLTDTLDIPIAACEYLTSRGSFKETISRRVMDIVQPDPSIAGGVGECLFVAELARLWGIACMPHCFGGPLTQAAAAHLVSVLPDSSWSRHTDSPMLEVDMSENRFREELLIKPMTFEGGEFVVPTTPGLGVEVNRDKLAAFSKSKV